MCFQKSLLNHLSMFLPPMPLLNICLGFYFPNQPVDTHNPNLGLMTKARAYNVEAQEGGPKVTPHASRSAKNVRE